MGWFSDPAEINPQTVIDLGTSEYTGQLDTIASEYMDPDSAFNQNILQRGFQNAQDSVYTSNRMNRMNNANTGINMSGIVDSTNMSNQSSILNNAYQTSQNLINSNYGQGVGILQGNQQIDTGVRENAVSAYGQNITNQNNHNAAMAGNVMNLASTAITMCDAKMKENIKPYKKMKIKNGKSVGLYRFNYKGRKKKHINVIAQEVQKHLPEAVQKGKNGLLYVDWSKLV